LRFQTRRSSASGAAGYRCSTFSLPRAAATAGIAIAVVLEIELDTLEQLRIGFAEPFERELGRVVLGRGLGVLEVVVRAAVGGPAV
jgi:hypothetical protein